jgi:hypothetical protein
VRQKWSRAAQRSAPLEIEPESGAVGCGINRIKRNNWTEVENQE